MSKTSTDVKRRYNEKTYKRWHVALKNDFFDEVEQARGELSRSEFLKMLYENYKNSKN